MTWANGITYGGAVWDFVAGKAASGLFEVAQMAVADVDESGGLAKGKTEPVASIFEGIAHFGGKLTRTPCTCRSPLRVF